MISDVTRKQFDRHVVARLRRLGWRLRVYLLIDGLAAISVAALSVVFITLLVDRTFRLERDMRVTQLGTVGLALAWMAWRWVVPAVSLRIGLAPLALLVERRYPVLRSRLISAVEFVEDAGKDSRDGGCEKGFSHQRESPHQRELVHQGHRRLRRSASTSFHQRRSDTDSRIVSQVTRSPAMVEAVVRQAQDAVAGLRFEEGLAHGRARRRFALVLGCLGVLGVMCLAAGDTMTLWFQRNVLLRNVDWPQRNRLILEGFVDGRMIVPRGDDVTVTAAVPDDYEAPRQVFIAWESQGGLNGRTQMPAVKREDSPRTEVSSGTPGSTRTNVRFTHTFERISEALRGQVDGGDARPAPFSLEVVDRPQVSDVTIRVTPPAYTQMAAYDLRAGQTVAEALKGSRIGFHIRTNRPLVEAILVRQAGEAALEIGRAQPVGRPTTSQPAQEFMAADLPSASATYHFRMTDELGLSNVSERARPLRLSVRLMADKPPQAKMRIKGIGEMITTDAVLPIETEFSDTYGLATVSLACELPQKGTDAITERIAGFEPGTKTFRRTIDWVPGRRGFIEGDRITLRAEASDFDDVSGPNVGRSAGLGLRVVSREELLAELNRREQEYRQDFERLVRQQEELYSEWLTLSRPTGSDAERAPRLMQLARRQRDFAGRVNTLRLQFEQLLAELEINRLATSAVEERITWRIVRPLDPLHRVQMPAAADRLDEMARQPSPEAQRGTRVAQELVLASMKTILANMLKWEGFQEAVTLLRDVQKVQRDVNQETEKRIESEILGTEPASEPATRPAKPDVK